MSVHAGLTCRLDTVHVQECRMSPLLAPCPPRAQAPRPLSPTFRCRFQEWSQGTSAVEFNSADVYYVCNNSDYYMRQALS